jgi:hypothetical protein
VQRAAQHVGQHGVVRLRLGVGHACAISHCCSPAGLVLAML